MIITSQMFKHLLLAQIIANVTPSLANISNGLLIGNSLSGTAMAALGFVAPTAGVFAALAAMFSFGANIMCGNSIGRGETKEVNRIFTTAISSLVALGIVLTIGCELFTDKVAAILGADGEALPFTIEYLRGLCIGIIPTLLVPCMVVFLNMANDIVYAMFSTIVLAGTNILVGIINLLFFDAGMFGMGLASAISQYAAFLFLLVRYFYKKETARLCRNGFVFSYIGKIIVLGSPAALMFFLYSIRNIQINTCTYEAGGTIAVTALGILNSSCGIFDAVNTGIGQTMVFLASVMVGEEDRKSLCNLLKYALTFGGALVIVKTGLFALLAQPAALLFGAKGDEIDIAKNCIYAYALCMPFNLIPVAFFKLYQCVNRVFFTNAMYVLTCIVFPIASMRLLMKPFGVYGVWSCYTISEVLTIFVLFVVCWIKSKHIPLRIRDFLWLEDSFETKEEHQIMETITTKEEAQALQARLERHFLTCRVKEEKAKQCLNFYTQYTDLLFLQKKKDTPLAIDFICNVKEKEVLLNFKDNGEYVVEPEDFAGWNITCQEVFGMHKSLVQVENL